MVKVSGEVFNIRDTLIQIWVSKSGSYDRVAVVLITSYGWGTILEQPLPEGIYEGTWITAYGMAWGYYEGTNAYGAAITQPKIETYIIEK